MLFLLMDGFVRIGSQSILYYYYFLFCMFHSSGNRKRFLMKECQNFRQFSMQCLIDGGPNNEPIKLKCVTSHRKFPLNWDRRKNRFEKNCSVRRRSKISNRSSHVFRLRQCVCFSLAMPKQREEKNFIFFFSTWCSTHCCWFHFIYSTVNLPVTRDSYYLICTSSVWFDPHRHIVPEYFSYASF